MDGTSAVATATFEAYLRRLTADIDSMLAMDSGGLFGKPLTVYIGGQRLS